MTDFFTVNTTDSWPWARRSGSFISSPSFQFHPPWREESPTEAIQTELARLDRIFPVGARVRRRSDGTTGVVSLAAGSGGRIHRSGGAFSVNGMFYIAVSWPTFTHGSANPGNLVVTDCGRRR